MKKKIIVVDDIAINRTILKNALESEYEVFEAADGLEALQILKKSYKSIAAIILDLIMPGMDGYTFFEHYQKSDHYKNIPVIVSTEAKQSDNEVRCLRFGAWDFIKKPFQMDVVRFRLHNVIERSQLNIYKELQYQKMYDSLTGIFRKDKFKERTRELLNTCPDQNFVILHIDIYKFQLFNSFYGMEIGDDLICYMASLVKTFAQEHAIASYGRVEADVFTVCEPYLSRENLIKKCKKFRQKLNLFRDDYDIVPVFGIYRIEDKTESITKMVDRANLAAKECKGNYIKNYTFYKPEMSQRLIKEQQIVNSMTEALKNEDFILYLQPKYELQDNTVDGAEVLVRWRDREKGIIKPSEFIPILEQNGFIMKLDYYIWEHACQLLSRWKKKGWRMPISVNISRVSLYNPNLVKLICDLVEKYDIEPELLQLELTENAYTSNPQGIKKAMLKLQKKGFLILMDDFGSGYSSLNVLKDIAVDVLKIDMEFMADCELPGRGENILASVVRMAKWLNMPVIAEGVERKEQVSFLRSIGCEFIQGFYFSKPIPIEDFETLAFSKFSFRKEENTQDYVDTDSLWTSTSQMEIIFSNMLQAVAMYEEQDGNVDTIRVNNAYYNLFGYLDIKSACQKNLIEYVAEEYRETVQDTFRKVVAQRGVASCEVRRKTESGKEVWVELKLKYISRVGSKNVIFGMLTDLTMQKEVTNELQRYKTALSHNL